MRVFRQTYFDKKIGARRVTGRWCVQFRDHLRVDRRWPAFDDRKRSERMGMRLETLVDCRRAHEQPPDELLAWIEGLPADIRQRLIDADLIDARRTSADRTLIDHLEGSRDADGNLTFSGFRQKLESKGCSAAHVDQQVRRARRIVEACGFVFWGDLSGPGAASDIEVYLSKLRADDATIGGRTSRYYLQSLKQFCRWMVRDKRAHSNPLAHVEPVQHVEADVEERRALTPEELRRLLRATAARGTAYGLSAEDRGLLYRFGVETGMRAGQIRKLTCGSFQLDADPPTVTSKAATVKRRVKHVQVIRPAMAAELRRRFANKVPDAPAFRVPPRTAEMLADDLAAARVAWIAEAPEGEARATRQKSDFLARVDHEGRTVVFHSLRHTHGTLLGAAGVPQRAIQASLHHTTGRTTERYLHSPLSDRRGALDALPELAEPQAATGTDGRAVELPHPNLPSNLPTVRIEMGSEGSAGGSETAVSDALGGNRTHTTVRSTDFKTNAQPPSAGQQRGNEPGAVVQPPLQPPDGAASGGRESTNEPPGGADATLARLAAGVRRLCGG